MTSALGVRNRLPNHYVRKFSLVVSFDKESWRERHTRNVGKPSLRVLTRKITRCESVPRSGMTAYTVQAYLCMPLLG
jgi:hypothetical protein